MLDSRCFFCRTAPRVCLRICVFATINAHISIFTAWVTLFITATAKLAKIGYFAPSRFFSFALLWRCALIALRCIGLFLPIITTATFIALGCGVCLGTLLCFGIYIAIAIGIAYLMYRKRYKVASK